MRSAMATVVKWVLARGTSGMIEASITRNPCIRSPGIVVDDRTCVVARAHPAAYRWRAARRCTRRIANHRARHRLNGSSMERPLVP